jgi:hypothetical protein
MTEEKRNEESDEVREAMVLHGLTEQVSGFLGAVKMAADMLVVDAADSYVTHDLAEKVLNNVAECLEEVDWDDRVGDHARAVDLADLVSEKAEEALGDFDWDDRVAVATDDAVASRVDNFDYDERVGEAIGEVDIRDVLTAHIDATLDEDGLSSIGLEEPFQLAIKKLLGEGVVDNFEAKWQDLVDTSVLAYNDCEKLTTAVNILERRLAVVENRGVRGWWRRIKAARQERRYAKAQRGAEVFHEMTHDRSDFSDKSLRDAVASAEEALGLRVHQPENGS